MPEPSRHPARAGGPVDLSRFDIPPGEPDPVRAIIARRRRQILVHSYLYYRLDRPTIDDATFDEWARDLVELQAAYPEAAADTAFADAFAGFTGSTGYDLPLDDPWVRSAALRLVEPPAAIS